MTKFKIKVNKSAKLTLLARFLLAVELLARVCLVLERVIKSLKSGMRVLAFINATLTSFLVIVFALLW